MLNSTMELTVFILLGVIVMVALLTRRVAARQRDAQANSAPANRADTHGPPKSQEPTE